MEEKERLNLLYSIFKLIAKKDIDMSSFNDRLKLQKITYIIISAGINLDYKFGWHLRGPYSSLLASDGFMLSNNSQSYIDVGYRIPEYCQKKIEEVRENFGSDLSDTSDTNMMELYSSILYIVNRGEKISDEKIIQYVKNRKPWFDEQTIKKALDKIRDSKIFSI
ncbi:MAG: hypothetical protein HYX24_02825 [Candidatus Aenigmarchaeota archaeon]|nr:hypothetical protein [Candidatus Aenigmarchaeota archaeon]